MFLLIKCKILLHLEEKYCRYNVANSFNSLIKYYIFLLRRILQQLAQKKIKLANVRGTKSDDFRCRPRGIIIIAKKC